CQHCEPVDFLDSPVGNRDTADRNAVSVQENIAARILLQAQDAVSSVRIADMKTQIEIALWIEPVELVESLGNLFVAEAPFWTEHPGGCANGVAFDQDVGLAAAFYPEFDRTLLLEGSKQDRFRRIADAFAYARWETQKRR